MAHRMNPFTGRETQLPPSRNSGTETNSNAQGQPQEEQHISTYQSYGGFAENSAYGHGDYSRPVPPTSGSIDPFHNTNRDNDQSQGTAREINPEYTDGYSTHRQSFVTSPEPSYANSSRGRRRSRLEDLQEQQRIGHRKNAMSALTGETLNPDLESEPEYNGAPSPWPPHQPEGDIEMKDFENIDLEAQPAPQHHSHRINSSRNHTINFWQSTDNVASERSCWQGFWANTRGDCIGVTVAIVVVMVLVVFFILLGVYYNSPDHSLKDE